MEKNENSVKSIAEILVGSELGIAVFAGASLEGGLLATVAALGAAASIAALPVAIALAVVAAVDPNGTGNASAAATAVSPYLSPTTVALVPISPIFNTEDPMQTAKVGGYLGDLFFGLASTEALDRGVAVAQAAINFSSFNEDLSHYGSPSATATPSSQQNNERNSSPSSSGGRGDAALPFSIDPPGKGDLQGASSNTSNTDSSPAMSDRALDNADKAASPTQNFGPENFSPPDEINDPDRNQPNSAPGQPQANESGDQDRETVADNSDHDGPGGGDNGSSGHEGEGGKDA